MWPYSGRLINPQGDAYQQFVDHDWQNIPIREQFIMLLRNSPAFAIITLGFTTFGVWHERKSGKAGTETTAVGLITLDSGTSEIGDTAGVCVCVCVGGGGGGGWVRKCWQFSQTRELKFEIEERYPIGVSKWRVPSKTR